LALSLLPFCFISALFSGERRELNYLSGFDCLTALCARQIDAVARDRQCAMEIVKLLCIEPYGFLAAPA